MSWMVSDAFWRRNIKCCTLFTGFVLTIPEHHRQYLRPKLVFWGEDLFKKKNTTKKIINNPTHEKLQCTKNNRRKLCKETHKNTHMPGFKKLEAKGAERQEVTMPAMSRRITRHGGQQGPEHGAPWGRGERIYNEAEEGMTWGSWWILERRGKEYTDF